MADLDSRIEDYYPRRVPGVVDVHLVEADPCPNPDEIRTCLTLCGKQLDMVAVTTQVLYENYCLECVAEMPAGIVSIPPNKYL